MRSHRAFTFDRLARIRRRLLALRYAPTVKDGLSELEVQRMSWPHESVLVMAGTSDARAVSAAGRLTRR